MITCPLCGEDDFDRIGFAQHIQRWCEEYTLALEQGQAEEAKRIAEYLERRNKR